MQPLAPLLEPLRRLGRFSRLQYQEGSFVDRDASTTARTLLLATNALLPSGLSTRELGQRDALEAQTDAIADLLIEGLRARS